jgi:dishevelled associated activator of morphogenesis
MDNLPLFFQLFRLAKEEEVLQLRLRAEELEKENGDLNSSLTKREQELDAKTQEKEDLQSNLERTKEKLELELQRANEARHRLGQLETTDEVASAASAPSSGAIVSVKQITLAAPPPPPPAPPMAPPPPPGPPPPTTGTPLSSTAKPTRKNVPQSSNPLKSFNWSKLPDCKVQGTIWTEMEETKLYKTINLSEVDRLFSAYQKNGMLVSLQGFLTWSNKQ